MESISLNLCVTSGHKQNEKQGPDRSVCRGKNPRNLHEDGQKPGWQPVLVRVYQRNQGRRLHFASSDKCFQHRIIHVLYVSRTIEDTQYT